MKQGKWPYPYDDYYGYLKNSHGFTYQELIGMGYTEELGFSEKVYNEVYDKENPMGGGYIIESTGTIVPAILENMTPPSDTMYYLETNDGWIRSDSKQAEQYFAEKTDVKDGQSGESILSVFDQNPMDIEEFHTNGTLLKITEGEHKSQLGIVHSRIYNTIRQGIEEENFYEYRLILENGAMTIVRDVYTEEVSENDVLSRLPFFEQVMQKYGSGEYFTEGKDMSNGVRMVRSFKRDWRAIPTTTNRSLKDLKKYLISDPDAGDVIKPKGKHKMRGARKLRWSSGKGSSYDIRIIYVYINKHKAIHLLSCYPKSVQEDLDVDQEKAIINLIIDLENKEV